MSESSDAREEAAAEPEESAETDGPERPPDDPDGTADDPEPEESDDTSEAGDPAAGEEPDLETLRTEVEERYDFDNFRPVDMKEMTAREWEAAFDPDTWITGTELLDRVEKDLRNRIAGREVFAVLDRRSDPESVVAYSDEGWAVVYADGSVEGEGTVLRDVKPTVALCSMDSYEVEEPPEEYELPTPEEVESGSGEFGNLMLQAVAAMQLLGGVGLFVAWIFLGVDTIVAPAAGVFFLLVGLFLFAIVANARLSDRFRADEYRDRLRAAGIADDGEAPEFAPFEEVIEEALAAARGEAEAAGADRQVPPAEAATEAVEPGPADTGGDTPERVGDESAETDG